MSTSRTLSPATAPPGTASRTGRDDSGIMLSPAEVALLRVSARPGTEGNELILRSGIIVPLTYAEAVEMRENLLRVEKLTVNYPDIRDGLFEVVASGR